MDITVDDDHEFGSPEITEVKLRLVENYLQAFSTALQGKFKSLWYIDAFAGTGTWTVKHPAKAADAFGDEEPERVERRRGSAKIAIDIKPTFDRLVFMEQRPKHFSALEALRDQHPGRDIRVLQGDANKIIQEQIKWSGWAQTRAVMFLDPFGMSVDWETLEAIRDTKAIDVWYLFSIEGIYRNAARDISAVDEHKRKALTRMLGTDEWEKELYSSDTGHIDLFTSEVERKRAADVAGLERYVTNRLRTLFPLVLEPYPLPAVKRPQRFSLYFAVSNDDTKALGLARRIGSQILSAAGR